MQNPRLVVVFRALKWPIAAASVKVIRKTLSPGRTIFCTLISLLVPSSVRGREGRKIFCALILLLVPSSVAHGRRSTAAIYRRNGYNVTVAGGLSYVFQRTAINTFIYIFKEHFYSTCMKILRIEVCEAGNTEHEALF